MGRHPEERTAPGARSRNHADTGRRTGRARRHLLVAGFVIGYLAAGGVTLLLGQRVAGGGWLALHLVLLGAATNAIVVWSEHFAAALLRAPPVSERVATGRALALNLGILGVLGGVHTGRSALAAGGACLAGVVVVAHALGLARRIGRALPGRLGGTVWFYVAAAAALLAGMGLGLWLAGGVAGSADGYRALRLAHVHLNVLGWVGLAVVGTEFTLWPTVLRTRMVPGVERAVRWSLPALAGGLAVAAAGLAGQGKAVALAGLASTRPGWASPWCPSSARPGSGHRTRRRPGCSGPAWPGWWSRSWATWARWPPARGWWTWTGGWPGWSRSWSPGSRCRP
jgi:nitrite reductase (NO-forming)